MMPGVPVMKTIAVPAEKAQVPDEEADTQPPQKPWKRPKLKRLPKRD